MLNESGLTLVEVLISLLIATSLSLQLLHHNWQLTQQFNQLFLHSDEYLRQANAMESQLFTLDSTPDNKLSNLNLRIIDEE